MKRLYRLTPFVLAFMPFAAMAAVSSDLGDIVTTLKSLADAIVPLFMVLAVAVFLWGIVKYITAGGDAAKEQAARGFIIYGLIGIFVLVAFWGIIQIVANTFGITTGGTLPEVNVSY